MGYRDARSHLDSLGIDEMKSLAPTTARMEALCEVLDHPERAVPAIHVTGTNGKTSTARILTSLLGAAGLSVGTYTSPHLQSVRERITLNGEPLSEDAFGDVFDHLRPFVDLVESKTGERLTYFEIMTAMFFLWAAENPVDAIVVEVGLGGRWDATNVVPSRVAVLTNVGLDHTRLLGEQRTTIAREKAGIIKRDAAVVTSERDPEVLSVIEGEASAAGARGDAAVLDRDFRLEDNRIALGGRYLDVTSGTVTYEDLFLPLHGRHQGTNAAVALEAAARFIPARPFDRDVVALGLAGAVVPGRLETIKPSPDSVPLVLDVAHNPDGASALVNALAETFAFERVTFVVGILEDKDHRGMLEELARLPCSLIVTQPQNARSVSADALGSAAADLGLESDVVDGVVPALTRAISATAPNELVCVTGSHYVVGEARDHLVGPLEDQGAR